MSHYSLPCEGTLSYTWRVTGNILAFYFLRIPSYDIIVKLKVNTVLQNCDIYLFKEILKCKMRLELFSAKSSLDRSSMVIYVRLYWHDSIHFGPPESDSQRALHKRLQNTKFHANCQNKKSSICMLIVLASSFS